MKNLDLNRPAVLSTEGEFKLFNPINCERALEMYTSREHENQFGLMQLKDHIIGDEVKHEDDCPALDKEAVHEIDRLLESA